MTIKNKKQLNFKTNDCLFQAFKEAGMKMNKMAEITGTHPNSLTDWFREKFQLKFNRLEELMIGMGYRIKIVVEKIEE